MQHPQPVGVAQEQVGMDAVLLDQQAGLQLVFVSAQCGSGRRNQFDDIDVKRRQPLIEGDQPAAVVAGQRGKVGVGHLPLADNASPVNVCIGQVSGPELVPRVADQLHQKINRCGHVGHGFEPKQHAHQCALRDRAGREMSIEGSEPVDRWVVVNMCRIGQRHQYIAVEQMCADSRIGRPRGGLTLRLQWP